MIRILVHGSYIPLAPRRALQPYLNYVHVHCSCMFHVLYSQPTTKIDFLLIDGFSLGVYAFVQYFGK